MKIKVSRKDLIQVIEEADRNTQWGSIAWKARRRLVQAINGVDECYRCDGGTLEAAPDDAIFCSSCAHRLTNQGPRILEPGYGSHS